MDVSCNDIVQKRFLFQNRVFEEIMISLKKGYVFMIYILLFISMCNSKRFNKFGNQRQNKQKNCYQKLEINENSSEKDIKKKFRKLALKYHPDKFKDDDKKKENEEYFKELTKCYQILSDKEKRQKYDAAGYDDNYEQYQTPFGGKGGGQFKFDFGDIFGDIFGNSKGKQRRNNAGNNGGFGGNSGFGGNFGGNFGNFGSNQRRTRQQGRERKVKILHVELKDIYDDLSRSVDGIRIKIPKGVPNGHIIKLKRNNIDVKINVLDDVEFKRGNTVMTRSHLYKTVDVTLKQALLGFDVSIKCLNGEIIDKHIDNIPSNMMYEIKGKGLPKFNGKKNGNLYLQFNVLFPDKLNNKQRINIKNLMNNDDWKYSESTKYFTKERQREKDKILRKNKNKHKSEL